MTFYCGMFHVAQAKRVQRSFISVNVLRPRKSPFDVNDWIMDSGAFVEISTYGYYRNSVEEYAAQINRWKYCGKLRAAVAQDYMCEAFIVNKTGLSVAEHQRLTVERYDLLRPLTDVYVLPVLQGYQPSDYVRHLEVYGDRLTRGQWVGVGSICKRNGNPDAIHEVLAGIKCVRPDLLLHGFGLKETSLRDGGVYDLLHTADSMAWSYSARKQGRNGNDWREAVAFVEKIESLKTRQGRLLMTAV